MKGSTEKISSAPCSRFRSPQDVFPLAASPPQQEHVIAIEDVELFHSGCLWKSMWAIMMERERERGEEEGEKRKKKKVPQGFWGPAKQLNGCKQHHSPHVQTFKISARVMGSAWPLSGCTKHGRSLLSKVYRNGRLVPHQRGVLMSKHRQNFFFFLHTIEIFGPIIATSGGSLLHFLPVVLLRQGTELPYEAMLGWDDAEVKIMRSQIVSK